MPDRDTVVFVPAWNEEDGLPAVLDELATGLPDAHAAAMTAVVDLLTRRPAQRTSHA